MNAPGHPPWKLDYGAQCKPDLSVAFRVWAPRLESLSLKFSEDQRVIPMARDGEDFHLLIPNLEAGADYMFVAGDKGYPDPVSRWQPRGVHSASRVVDPTAFSWSDSNWQGIALENLIIYELHTGTFTPEGTFEAVLSKLPYLRQLGVTAIELMPIAEFPGARNWGYDGVCLYAPHSGYGGPAGLKKLVDACHCQGIAVLLDVVYNHLGPEGNYLSAFAPYFSQTYRTPWGEALNFDAAYSDGVRRFFIDNALYWVTEYHIDALRLDAVHGIYDFGGRHILQDLATAVHEEGSLLGRKVHVIAESDLNDVRVIQPSSEGGYGLDAQWLDEFHHSLRSILIDSRQGYLSDFGKLDDLRKAIAEGFVHDGSYSRHRHRHYGSSSKDCPGRQFVSFIQNHDQIANASYGERLSTLVTIDQQKLAAVVLLCSPYIPLLFMGQEYGETSPFHYFTSFDDIDLAEAVREGRRQEFAAFTTDRHFCDPQDPATFEQSRPDWRRFRESPHSKVLCLYRDLISCRMHWPCLSNCRKDLTQATVSQESKWMVIVRTDLTPSRGLVICNFADREQSIPVDLGDEIWFRQVWTGAEMYGGFAGASAPAQSLNGKATVVTLGAWQAVVYTSSG